MSVYPQTNSSLRRDFGFNSSVSVTSNKIPVLPITTSPIPIQVQQKGSIALDYATNNLYISSGIEWLVIEVPKELQVISTNTTLDGSSGTYYFDSTSSPLNIQLLDGNIGNKVILSLLYKRSDNVIVTCSRGTFELNSTISERILIMTSKGWKILDNYNNSFYPVTRLDGPLTVSATSIDFGISSAISADGNTVAIGSDGQGVFIFIRNLNTGLFSQFGGALLGNDATAGSRQGYSVALSANGNTVAFGGPGDSTNIGAVWVFTRPSFGQNYTQLQTKLIGTDNLVQSERGTSVALSADGNTLAIGAPKDAASIGTVYIFTRASFGGQYTQLNPAFSPSLAAKITGTGNTGASQQGTSIALSADGNTLAVGGPKDDPSGGLGVGAVWVFTRASFGSTYTQLGLKITGASAIGRADQGTSVALSADGNTLAFGGPRDNSSIGAFWVYNRPSFGLPYTLIDGKIVAVGVTNAPQQGTSIALSSDGNTLAVGGPFDNAGLIGCTWVFTRPLQNTQVIQKSQIIITDARNSGRSVALSSDGSTLVIGSVGESLPSIKESFSIYQ